MTTINLTHIRGDSKTLAFTVLDENAAPVDLTDAIVRFAVKTSVNDSNDDAIFVRRSYNTQQVEITSAVAGEVSVKIEKADTRDADITGVTPYKWDIEVCRQGDARTGASGGTIAVTAGAQGVVGSGTAFLKARKGDILVPAGGSAPNQKPIVIMEVTDNTNLVTDYSDWATEAGVSFTIKVADVKTPGQGDFTLTFDVVR